jgi:8-oxo-dGTP pyrophosphatase MutT (NUDIX family)
MPSNQPAIKDRITRQLQNRRQRQIHRALEWREAAVLIPLSWHADEQEWFVLFTRRTQHVGSHKGQISFPGGRRDPGDRDLVATALREAHEEIGLAPDDVIVLGACDEMPSHSAGLVIAPFVGIIPHPYPFVINPMEIEELIEVPLSFFRHPAYHRVEPWEWDGRRYQIHFYDWQHHTIWGLTAGILTEFLDILFAGELHDEEDRPHRA